MDLGWGTRLMDQYKDLGITLYFPTINGIFNNGPLAAIGAILNYFFVIMMMIWIGYSIYAAYKIVLSQGAEKDIETGITLIKNVWISITWGVVFFIAISIVGAFSGIGDITQWYIQLSQCNGQSFYFKDMAEQKVEGYEFTHVYCCKVSGSSGISSKLGYEEGESHFIGSTSESNTGFSDCKLVN